MPCTTTQASPVEWASMSAHAKRICSYTKGQKKNLFFYSKIYKINTAFTSSKIYPVLYTPLSES
jgi:hypothetical protein